MKIFIHIVLMVLLCNAAFAQPTTRHSLIADLRGTDDVKRSLAKQLLRREGATVVPNVLPLLDHDDPSVWNAADKLLADIIHWVGEPGRELDRAVVSELCMEVLRADESDELMRRLLRHVPTLVAEGHDVSAVAALLGGGALSEKARVALVNAGTTEAVRALGDALHGANLATLEPVLRGLGQTEHEAALAYAVPYLKAEVHSVAAAAAHAVAWAGRPTDSAAIVAVYEKTQSGEEQRAARDAVLKHLHAMGEAGGNVSTLQRFCKQLLSKDDAVLQGGAMALLGQFSDEAAVGLILDVLNEENVGHLGPQAVTALARQQGRAADEALLTGYDRVPAAVRPMYLSMLGRRNSAVFVPMFSEALDQDYEAMRDIAITGLVESRRPGSLKPLANYASAHEGEAKAAALAGLERLSGYLASDGKRPAAGQGYLALYRISDNAEQKQRAEDGIRQYPVPQAAKILMEILTPEELSETPVDTLLEIVHALGEAEMMEQVAQLEGVLRSRLGTTEGVQAVMAHAEATGKTEQWKNDLGFIRTWQVVGPFPWNKTDGFLPPPFDVQETDTRALVQAGSAELEWTEYHSDGIQPIFDLWDPMTGAVNSSAYAYTEVTVGEATSAQLRLGSDDGVRAWVNGTVVHEHNVDRGVALDSDVVAVELDAGKNAILIQIVQNGGGWGFVGRLTDRDGVPLSFE